MIPNEERLRFARSGLDIDAIEADLSIAAGGRIKVVDTHLGFMETLLVLETPDGTQYTFSPGDTEAWPLRKRMFRKSRPVLVPDLIVQRNHTHDW